MLGWVMGPQEREGRTWLGCVPNQEPAPTSKESPGPGPGQVPSPAEGTGSCFLLEAGSMRGPSTLGRAHT